MQDTHSSPSDGDTRNMLQLNWLLQLACRVADAVSCSVVDLLVSAIRETPGHKGENVHLADKWVIQLSSSKTVLTVTGNFDLRAKVALFG